MRPCLSCTMRVLLLAWILTFKGARGQCQEEACFTFDGDIRHLAVAAGSVYVATAETLYHLDHSLNLIQSLSQRGTLDGGKQQEDGRFQRVSEGEQWNKTFSVNTLVPFIKNDTLITCGITDCGYCELLDLGNISKLVHQESIQVGSLKPGSASVGFLVDVEVNKKTETYILTAIQQYETKDGCFSTSQAVNLQNTKDNQKGGIFSFSDGHSKAVIERKDAVEFVDGFQVSSTVYLFSNVPFKKRNKVRLIWLKSKESKIQTLKSPGGATLECCGADEGNRLVASSVIPGGPPVLWAGVFSVDGASTALVVFDISPVQTKGPYNDPDFCGTDCTKDVHQPQPESLRPKAVLFKHSSMTSVLAVKQKAWTVFFMGTGDGQLFKLAMDKSYQTGCPRVVYRTDDDRKVFPQMHLDQVDRKHVYVALGNQMQRVPVSQCKTHKSLKACWSAQDPYCGWCGSTESCTFEDECRDSVWLSIPDDSNEQKMFSYQVRQNDSQITLTFKIHVSAGRPELLNFACQFSTSINELCDSQGLAPQFPQCTCILNSRTLPDEGLDVTVKFRLGNLQLSEQLKLTNCSDIRGQPTFALCHQCITTGCGWSNNVCSWVAIEAMNDSVCQMSESGLDAKPQISSITPSVLSFYGRNHAVMTGRNLRNVIKVLIRADMDCSPKESPVWNNTGISLTFHIPSGDKGLVNVCVALPDGSCHGNASITYCSLPSCTAITPNSTWASGKRNITILGSYLEFVEGVVHSHAPDIVSNPRNSNFGNLTYDSLPLEDMRTSTLSLKVANRSLTCSSITYHPDPKFSSFTSTRTGDEKLRVTIQKKADRLEMTMAELSVWGVHGDAKYDCLLKNIYTSNGTDFVICEIRSTLDTNIQSLMIKYGDQTVTLEAPSNQSFLMLFVLLLIPCIIVAVLFIYRSKQKKLTAQMNRRIEDLELDIRNDIRQGFVDLQTEKAELMENVGAIPFLDYKHFASRIFFPEGGALMTSCLKDIGQDGVKVQSDECCQALSRLIQDQLFLTSMVHALEEQKTFTVKDKCVLASVLTVALHGDLFYLTEVMEDLLAALMQQPSNAHPKLLLRRTQSTVEKLLTNWMSVCLYGFLRESVGQHLFLLVSALTQHIAKGPVDSVTEKALYTLSEDWLLWQAQDFTSLKLKVLFALGSDGEVSEPLEVDALSCDTVQQVKEKILSTFKAKFGFPYNAPLRDVRIEYEKDGSFVPLEEVDGSSEVLGDVTMLNTLKHYEVPDGASIKVLSKKHHPPLSPQGSLKDDQDFSVKYFHLIDPDVDEDQRKNPERKKVKLKEVHLTKLLSTKVAVHSFVEKLFRSIWGTPHCRALHAVKYFFDFLDTQADNMKITDPDVVHIWKTNSLPLRFWINILKNPQFVFDMEKTPHLDGCLSVIAQAFMDSFSLTDTQLGKHAPTNKLLYAKDIPQYKQEVKAYYKLVREQPPITSSEFRDFLLDESKKHENEFNETAALRELYKFVQRYFTEIKQKLDQNGAPPELKEQLQHVKSLFDGLKSCSWD